MENKPERQQGRIPRTVIMLGFVSLLTDSASEMIYPLIPVFVSLLGSGAVVLGIMEGIAETTASFLKLFSGIISDRIGKRKLLVVAGYVISSAVRPLMGLVSSGLGVVLIRMTDRIGKGIRSSPRDALIASSVDESIRGKSFGFHRAMDHTGAVIGPLLALGTLLFIVTAAGISDPLKALRLTFLIAFIPGLLAVAVLLLFVRESGHAGSGNKAPAFSLRGLDRNFRNYLLITVLFALGNSSDAFLLFRVDEAMRQSGAIADIVYGIGPLKSLVARFGDEESQMRLINILFLPLLWAYFHLIKAAFSVPLGSLSDRIGRKKTISIGWSVYVFIYFMFALLVFIPSGYQVPATLILFAVYALFYAFTEGAQKAFIADLVPEEKRGTAYGLFNFSLGIGALPSSIVFGFIYSYFDRVLPGYGGTIAFSLGGMLALAALVLLFFKVKESVREQKLMA